METTPRHDGTLQIEGRRSELDDAQYDGRAAPQVPGSARSRTRDGEAGTGDTEQPAGPSIGAGRNDVLADASDEGPQGVRFAGEEERPSRPSYVPLYPPGPADRDGWAYVFDQMPSLKPTFCRMANGNSTKLDSARRLRSVGNGVVPAVAALAWRDLTAKLC